MVLRINLTRQSYEIQMISDGIFRRGLGGKGLAVFLLSQHNSPDVAPLSPDNHVVFANGPTAGTAIWGPSCYGVFTQSPYSGLFTQSYAGGNVANHISSTGFDAIILHGTSEYPVWLEVQEDSVVFHSAVDLWRKSIYEAEEHVKNWIKTHRSGNGRCGVVAIDPASEARVSRQTVENHCRNGIGINGTGVVLGSKKVKAVVFRGNKVKTIADPERIKTVSRIMSEKFRKKGRVVVSWNPVFSESFESIFDSQNGAGGLSMDIGCCRWISRGDGTKFAVKRCPAWAISDDEDLVERVDVGVTGEGATIYREWEDRLTLFQSTIFCPLFCEYCQWDELTMIFEGVVGIHFSISEFQEIAKNVIDDTRYLNRCADL